jgi:hypothetical protein
LDGVLSRDRETNENIDDDKGLFHKDQSRANVGLSFKVESDLGNGFGFGARLNILETLGLEHNLVSGTMQNVNGVDDHDDVTVRTSMAGPSGYNMGQSDDEWYFGEAYITKTLGATTIKAGRQELNTPLVYSEKWNVLPNTFDAVVLLNQDLADQGITLVGAYVSKRNHHKHLGQFNSMPSPDGAYAAAAVYNNSDISGQAWFYNVPSVANAYWMDANYGLEVADGQKVAITAQLAGFMLDDDPADGSDTDSMAAALQGSYDIVEGTKVCLAASLTTGEKSSHAISNVGTGIKTKIATHTISADGPVAGATDTKSYKLTLKQDLSSIAENTSLKVDFAQFMHGEDSSSNYADETATAFETVLKSKVSGMDVMLAYIMAQNIHNWTVKKTTETESETSHTVRVVARYNF